MYYPLKSDSDDECKCDNQLKKFHKNFLTSLYQCDETATNTHQLPKKLMMVLLQLM